VCFPQSGNKKYGQTKIYPVSKAVCCFLFSIETSSWTLRSEEIIFAKPHTKKNRNRPRPLGLAADPSPKHENSRFALCDLINVVDRFTTVDGNQKSGEKTT